MAKHTVTGSSETECLSSRVATLAHREQIGETEVILDVPTVVGFEPHTNRERHRGAGALRMRRFYVGKSLRRNGTGRAIAEKLLAHARASGRLVTVNAAAVGSEPFWQSSGFISELRNGHTHVILEIPGLGR